MMITLATAGICGIILLILSARVVRGRFSGKVSLGDGGDPAMLARIRAQANFTEYVPIVLILLGLVESNGGNRRGVGALAIAFIAARILHPLGMQHPPPNFGRGGGAMLTFLVLAILSVWAVLISARLHNLY